VTKLVKGQNIILENQVDFLIEITSSKQNSLDISLFLLNGVNKIENEKDFFYFNNPKSETVDFSFNQNSVNIDIKLNIFKQNISTIPIIATINENTTFADFKDFQIFINKSNIFEIEATTEKSLIIGELYLRKGVWKFKIRNEGYNSGLEVIAKNYGLDISNLSEQEKLVKFRKSSKDVILDYLKNIKEQLKLLSPHIVPAISEKFSESDTRMLIDRIFIDVLGYKLNEVKTEQKIGGRRADYILSVKNVDHIVVEVKKAGMPLREKQVFQATSYGAYSGIKWALLTNLETWQLYYINSGNKIEPELIFSFEIEDRSVENINFLFAISRNGIIRKNILEKIKEKVQTLSQANIIGSMLSDDVISKIRTTINKNSSYKASQDEVFKIVEDLLVKL